MHIEEVMNEMITKGRSSIGSKKVGAFFDPRHKFVSRYEELVLVEHP